MFLLPDVLHPFHLSGPESHCLDVQSKSGDRDREVTELNFKIVTWKGWFWCQRGMQIYDPWVSTSGGFDDWLHQWGFLLLFVFGGVPPLRLKPRVGIIRLSTTGAQLDHEEHRRK